MPVHAWPVLLGSLAIGTATLSLLGSAGAALTVGVRRGSALLALLALPLEVPVLIFGAQAVDLAIHAESATASLKLLAAILLLSACLAPLATAMAMRVSVET